MLLSLPLKRSFSTSRILSPGNKAILSSNSVETWSEITLTNDQALHDIYTWILDRLGSNTLEEPDNREAWRPLREAHTRVRNRRSEGREALAGEGKWCTTAFWDDVVAPPTGASTDVTDALRKIKRKSLAPIGVMRRGCLEMFKRLSGESKTRFRKDQFCTGGDLKAANLGTLSEEQLTHSRFLASLLQKTMTLDDYGFLWHHPPRNSIAETINQQRVQEARDLAPKQEKTVVAQEVTGNHNLRKRQKETVDEDEDEDEDEDDMGAVEDLPSVPIHAFKKPARGATSHHAQKTSETDEIFNQLSVVRTRAKRQRAESIGKNGEPAGPQRLAIPVKNSTRTQNQIWEVIESRVRGVTERKTVEISREGACQRSPSP
jgi:hypothetical protein